MARQRVATIGQPRIFPQLGRADWLSAGKPVTMDIRISSLFAIVVRSHRAVLLYFTEEVWKIRESQAAVWFETAV